jgi:UDP-perosamine 4-acetyltransferase
VDVTAAAARLIERPCIVLGAGGHARVVVDLLLLHGATVAGLYAPDASLRGQSLLGIEIRGADDAALALDPSRVWAVNGVASLGPVVTRRMIYERFVAAGFQFPSIIHPSATVSASARLAGGVQVCAGAVVGPAASVGENGIVNTRAIVEHDCRIAPHAHIAPGAVLCGGVAVGVGAHIGAGAVVVQGLSLGMSCLVAAGAAVVEDVPDHGRVAGVPARSLAP